MLVDAWKTLASIYHSDHCVSLRKKLTPLNLIESKTKSNVSAKLKKNMNKSGIITVDSDEYQLPNQLTFANIMGNGSFQVTVYNSLNESNNEINKITVV